MSLSNKIRRRFDSIISNDGGNCSNISNATIANSKLVDCESNRLIIRKDDSSSPSLLTVRSDNLGNMTVTIIKSEINKASILDICPQGVPVNETTSETGSSMVDIIDRDPDVTTDWRGLRLISKMRRTDRQYTEIKTVWGDVANPPDTAYLILNNASDDNVANKMKIGVGITKPSKKLTVKSTTIGDGISICALSTSTNGFGFVHEEIDANVNYTYKGVFGRAKTVGQWTDYAVQNDTIIDASDRLLLSVNQKCGEIIKIVQVDTINNTPQNVFTFNMPDKSAILIDVKAIIHERNDSPNYNNESATRGKRALCNTDSSFGNNGKIGEESYATFSTSSLTTTSLDIVTTGISGEYVNVQVTGVSGKYLKWRIVIKITLQKYS